MASHPYSKDLKKKHFSLTPTEHEIFESLKKAVCLEQKMTSIPRQANINTFRFMLQLTKDYFTGKLVYVEKQ